MLSREEFFSLMDAVYVETTTVVELPDIHPCKACPAFYWDPEYCRGCADVDLCPGLHPDFEDNPEPIQEPAYRKLFKALIG